MEVCFRCVCGATSCDGARGGEVFQGQLLEFVFVFGGPKDVGFDRSENANMVMFNVGAHVDPFGPIVLWFDTVGVLKGEAECVFMFWGGECCHRITPRVVWERGCG